MDCAILVSGSKEASGFCEIDQAGITQTSNYKQSAAKKNCVALIGRDGASFSGISAHQADYIAVAQLEKPALVLYQRGKSSPLFQCPMQEIINCVTTDTMGTYLFSGTRKGFIYVHDIRTGELITTWQAHLKAVNKLQVTGDCLYLVSVGDDGLGRCWNIPIILDPHLIQQHGLLKVAKSNENRLLTPFRSWNAHTLPVLDVFLIDFGSCLRAITCSIDRTVHFYDVLHQNSISRVTLPGDTAAPLECLTLTNGLEYVLTGSSTGKVFTIDISVVAAGVSAVQHTAVVGGSSMFRAGSSSSSNTSSMTGIHCVDAHSLAVTAIVTLPDNERFVTASLDGYVKFYNVFTRQLLAECTPLLQRGPVTNLSILLRGESSTLTIVKPTIASVAPLKKYVDSAGNSTAAAVAAASASAAGNSTTVVTHHAPTANIAEQIASVVGTSHSQGLTQGSVVLGPTFLGVTGNDNVFSRTELYLQSLRDGDEIKNSIYHGLVCATDDADETGLVVSEALHVEEEFIRLPKVAPLQTSKAAKRLAKSNEKAKKEESDEEDDIMRFDEGDDEDEDGIDDNIEQSEQEEVEEEDEEEGEEVEEEDEKEGEEEADSDLKQALLAKDIEIAALQEENQRWKTLCEQMKSRFENVDRPGVGNKRGRSEDEVPVKEKQQDKKQKKQKSK